MIWPTIVNGIVVVFVNVISYRIGSDSPGLGAHTIQTVNVRSGPSSGAT